MKVSQYLLVVVLFILSTDLMYSQVKRYDKYYSSEYFVSTPEMKVNKSDHYLMFCYFNNQLISFAIMKKGTTESDNAMVYSLYDTGVDLTGNSGVIHRVYESKADEYSEDANFIKYISIDSKYESLMFYDDETLLGGFVLDYLETRE